MNFSSQNIKAPATPDTLAHPLDELYARSGMSLPPLKLVEGEEVPEPYKTLLVHQHDMTSTLEAFHRQRVRITVLHRDLQKDIYLREVVLKLEESEKPVEFGAIKIQLGQFPAAARELVLEERWPLGRILKECAVQYLSRPKAFLHVASDRLISQVLGLTGAQMLYGRRNTLTDLAGNTLADIVEILPPEKQRKGGT
jgi:chorismate-pyruvate lyase